MSPDTAGPVLALDDSRIPQSVREYVRFQFGERMRLSQEFRRREEHTTLLFVELASHIDTLADVLDEALRRREWRLVALVQDGLRNAAKAGTPDVKHLGVTG